MTAKKKKTIWISIFLVLVIILFRPIRSKYRDAGGSIGMGSDIKRTGIFSVSLNDGAYIGKLGLLGNTIDWVRVLDGYKTKWTAII